MTPTDEQQLIIEAARATEDNLLVNALAGAAKTTTLVMIAHAVPLQPILCLAFNKRIAEEMKKRLPGHCQSATVNSIGHRAWASVVGRKLIVSTDKNYTLLKEEIETLARADKEEAMGTFPSILRAISLSKLNGYVPEAFASIAPSLQSREEFFDAMSDSLDDPINGLQATLIDGVISRSIKAAYTGQIDFDDQIYMSTLFGGQFPQFPLILVDEAQDLSPLNHAMLGKLVNKRIIAVGDPYQSVYAFRGADHQSMQHLRETFSMREMGLSISFRCPIEVVKRARFRAPHMKWWDGAYPGKIERLESWSGKDIPDGAGVICRNNAPLFHAALRLIREGRGVRLVGSDIGPGLIRLLKKLGPPTLTQEETLNAIKAWEEAQVAKSKEARHAAIRDRGECLRVFARYGSSLSEAIAYAEHLFSSLGPIQLLSGHKSKGLEWDIVFHLDPWRIPSKYARRRADEGDSAQLQQEMNLRYVIETRPKKELYLVDMEGWK